MGTFPAYIIRPLENSNTIRGESLTVALSKLIVRIPVVSVLNRLANRALLAPKGGEGGGGRGAP